MSMPSDTNADVTEAMERTIRPPRPRPSQLTTEQVGWAVVALAAFFGVTYGGPALARWRRRPPLKQRLAQRAEAARTLARKKARRMGGQLRRRARRLGGGARWH